MKIYRELSKRIEFSAQLCLKIPKVNVINYVMEEGVKNAS